jgi:hypothetical protein
MPAPIWDLTIPILSATTDIVRSRGSPTEASKPLQSDLDGQGRVYGERTLHERTRADAAIARLPNLKVSRGPQHKCRPERCGSLMQLVASNDIKIETRPRKRRADAAGLTGLHMWIIKSTLRPSSRAAGAMQAPTSAQAVRGQGLQKGVQRARTWAQGSRQSRQAAHLCGPRRRCQPRQRQRRGAYFRSGEAHEE